MKNPIIMRYVNLVSRWRKFKINANRVMSCVLGNNKKIKKGGASPVNGETLQQRKKNAEFSNTIYRLLSQPDCI